MLKTSAGASEPGEAGPYRKIDPSAAAWASLLSILRMQPVAF